MESLTPTPNPQDAELFRAWIQQRRPIPLGNRRSPPDALVGWASAALPWHYRGDELAGRAARALRAAGASRMQPARGLRELAAAGDPDCAALLADMEAVPDWVDFGLMRRGGAMAQRQFPMLILALTYGCMPLTFANPDAAAVFAGTGRMEAGISRRLNESATLFFGVTNSDELAPGGRMWEACLQVRLVHAIVRMHLLDNGWDVPGRGMPVSQLATAAGPAFFGTHLLECLRRLGASISEEEAAGHCMIWRYVTRLMGVPQTLLGHTQAEQDEFDLHVSSLFFAPDETARTIMASLVDGLAIQRPTSRIPRDLQLALFHRMLGETMATAYGIERSPAGERRLDRLVRGLSAWGRMQQRRPLAAVLQRTGRFVLGRLASDGLVKLEVAGTSR